MSLLLLVLALAAVSFWAGFKARPHPLQYLSKAGFVAFSALAVFTGYFAVREARTLSELGERVDERTMDYRIVTTTLTVDSVVGFYRGTATGRGWTIETDDPPWMILEHDAESLTIFVSDDFPRPRRKVLYAYEGG